MHAGSLASSPALRPSPEAAVSPWQLTLDAEPLGAVLGLLAQALAVFAAVAGRGRGALPHAQVLALGAAH